MAERPHISFPFRRGPNGKVAVVEQDSPAHIDSCCQAIIHCPTGWRSTRPEFGWSFPEFENAPLDKEQVASAIRQFEPRASNVQVEQWADAVEDGAWHLSIDVEAR